jgi:hypothetical protein
MGKKEIDPLKVLLMIAMMGEEQKQDLADKAKKVKLPEDTPEFVRKIVEEVKENAKGATKNRVVVEELLQEINGEEKEDKEYPDMMYQLIGLTPNILQLTVISVGKELVHFDSDKSNKKITFYYEPRPFVGNSVKSNIPETKDIIRIKNNKPIRVVKVEDKGGITVVLLEVIKEKNKED